MFCFVLDSVSCRPGWPGTVCVVVDALKVLILPPPNAGFTGVHHISFIRCWESNSQCHAC